MNNKLPFVVSAMAVLLVMVLVIPIAAVVFVGSVVNSITCGASTILTAPLSVVNAVLPVNNDGHAAAIVNAFVSKDPSIAAQQRQNAATIITVGAGRKEPHSNRDLAIAVGVAIQESDLINLPRGDRDSLGLFQQRPSVGVWGTASQIMDPVHATNAFFDAMFRNVPNRDALPMVEVGIAVQNPSKAAYHRNWKWDDIALAFVTLYHPANGQTADAGNTIATPVTNQNSCTTQAGVSVAAGDGSVHLPLDPGYHVSSGFADLNRPVGTRPHIGIDLVYGGNTAGRPVYSAFNGVVVASGAGHGCNKVDTNAVMIKSAEGFQAGYLHMNGSDITVHKGDQVVAGQVIGKIGMCGPATGPHLHFEITPDSDKEQWLSSLKSVQKFGSTWIDPVGFMAHYGVKLVP